MRIRKYPNVLNQRSLKSRRLRGVPNLSILLNTLSTNAGFFKNTITNGDRKYTQLIPQQYPKRSPLLFKRKRNRFLSRLPRTVTNFVMNFSRVSVKITRINVNSHPRLTLRLIGGRRTVRLRPRPVKRITLNNKVRHGHKFSPTG